MVSELVDAIVNLDEEKTLALVQSEIDGGKSPLNIIEQCRQGVQIVGQRYAEETYYLSDLIMSEEIMRGVIEILEPHFPKLQTENGTKVVIGTVEGDIHDIGKNIIGYLLRSIGFQVYDLGVDVSPEAFIQTIIETGAKIVGISILLTFSITAVKKVIRLLSEAGLRDNVKIIIGGYPVNEKIREFTGADYYENDPIRALELIKKLATQ